VPELIEVETYRRAAAAVAGRQVEGVDAPDGWFLKGGVDGDALAALLVGSRIVAIGRHGKILLLSTDVGPVLGLRFGMTGRLVVDGEAPITELEYGPSRHDAVWERFRLRFTGGGDLVMVDPRRLGGVVLDPDLSALGPDAATLSPLQLSAALTGSRAPLKAALLDQGRVAGLGNLLVDETLWRAGLPPVQSAGELTVEGLGHLAATVRATVRELSRRGGSHTGDLQEHRRRGGACPRCGAPLARDRVGGRTTYWCRSCQVV
jgi:formamidopyrimidine-DNA glycosylase